MTSHTPGREVFQDIDPDPDAVLAAFGAESPEDLVAGGGAHDPVPDDQIDADDTTAAELFADLEASEPTLEADVADGVADGADVADGTADGADVADGTADGADVAREIDDLEFDSDSDSDSDLEFDFVGDANVIVRDDGAVIDASAAELSAVDTSGRPADAEGVDADAEGVDADAKATDTVEPSATTATENDSGTAANAARARESRTLSFRDTAAELELAGGDLETTRIADERFGTD